MHRRQVSAAVLPHCSMTGVSYVFAIGSKALLLICGELTMEKSINFLDGTIVILLALVGFAIISAVPNLI